MNSFIFSTSSSLSGSNFDSFFWWWISGGKANEWASCIIVNSHCTHHLWTRQNCLTCFMDMPSVYVGYLSPACPKIALFSSPPPFTFHKHLMSLNMNVDQSLETPSERPPPGQRVGGGGGVGKGLNWPIDWITDAAEIHISLLLFIKTSIVFPARTDILGVGSTFWPNSMSRFLLSLSLTHPFPPLQMFLLFRERLKQSIIKWIAPISPPGNTIYGL